MPRPPAKNFQELIVWQKAHEFVLGVYTLTKDFPREEVYGLTSQLRRTAVSVPANIAEGFKKRYGDTERLQQQLDEVSRLLAAYCQAVLRSYY